MRVKEFLILVFCASRATGQIAESPHFALKQLAEGVYAAIASDTGYAVSNAGIVDLGDSVLIFDTFLSPRAAADLRRAALVLTGKPIGYVVNSHFHNDHIRGNQVFSGAYIVSTVNTRKAIAENEPEEILWENEHARSRLAEARKTWITESDTGRIAEDKFWMKYYESIVDSHDSLKTVLPDMTFEGKLVLRSSGRSVELIEEGGGHTESDVILYLPLEHIVFTGDLVFIDRHPYLPDGSPDGWLKSLERIEALDPSIVIPGHGPVGDKSHLAIMAGYIHALKILGAGLAQRGAGEQEMASQPVPPAYGPWWYSRFFLPNLKFLVEIEKKRSSPK